MPTLPSINITDATTWDRIFAAFNGSATEFKSWQLNALREEVQLREANAIEQDARNRVRTKFNELNTLIDSGKVTWSTPKGAKALKEDKEEK